MQIYSEQIQWKDFSGVGSFTPVHMLSIILKCKERNKCGVQIGYVTDQ